MDLSPPKYHNGNLNMLVRYIKYVLSKSDIHGFFHLAAKRRHISEITFWACLIILGVYSSIVISAKALDRYLENPTVISIELNRLAWNTSFPSVTICPKKKIDEDALQQYLDQSNAINKTKLKEFILTLSKATYNNFETIPEYDDIPSEKYMELLIKLHLGLKTMITCSPSCQVNLVIHQVVTEMGICYSMHSQLALYNTWSYWKENNMTVFGQDKQFVLNPLDGEVFSMISCSLGAMTAYIHGSYEVADILHQEIMIEDGNYPTFYVTPSFLYSADRIKKLQIAQRKCRFYFESNLKRSPVYSSVLCRMECRATLAQKLCGCIPHFYRALDGETVCNVTGLHCLAKHKNRIISLGSGCSCVPNCDEMKYTVDSFDNMRFAAYSDLSRAFKIFPKGIVLSLQYPKIRFKRDVIFGFSDMLVQLGSMVCLFLGCSVLSMVQIIYFFTLRLYWFWHLN